MKKHLTPDGWKKCSAQPGNCPLGSVEHMDTSKVTLTQILDAQKANKFEEYYLLRTAYEQEQGQSIHEIADPSKIKPQPGVKLQSITLPDYEPYLSGVEYEYGHEYNHTPGCHEERICRCGRIKDVQFHSIDTDAVIESYVYGFNKLPKAQQEQIRLIAASEGVHNVSNYDAEISGGYYGEELGKVSFTNHVSFLNKLQAFAIASPNYSDEAGVLNYARDKGLNTAGLTPVQALKEQLATENNGRILKVVANAKAVKVETLKIADIYVPNVKHYVASEARAIPKNGFAGVVVRQNGRYRLLDGYHRMKGLNENGRRVKAKYLILE